jgi:acyl-CoA synthetase (AMP-forming)/AMP-acid ligase II
VCARCVYTGSVTALRIDGERRVPWRSVPELVRERALLGSQVAIADDAGEMTFSALDAAMGVVGRAVAGMGVGPGDRVALWAPNSIRWVEVALGVLANGAVVVPMSTRLRGEEAAHVLRASGASVLFMVEEHLGISFLDLLAGAGPGMDGVAKVGVDDLAGVPGGAAGLMPWAEFLALGEEVAPADMVVRSEKLSQPDPAFVVFTSGTTGRPKGAILHHGALLYSAVQMEDGFDLRDDDRLFVVLPLFHVFGLAMLFSSVVSGARFSTTAAAFHPDAMVASMLCSPLRSAPWRIFRRCVLRSSPPPACRGLSSGACETPACSIT